VNTCAHETVLCKVGGK